MQDFIYTFSIILLIFVEIFTTVFCVKKLLKYETKVDETHVKMLEKAKEILEINDEIQKTIVKINKVIRILSNKKLHQIKNIIMMTLDIIQVVILIKSLNFSKGIKSINFKTLQKLAYAKIGHQVAKKVLDFAQNLCAI